MKKKLLLLTAFFSFSFNVSKGQVQNGNFEMLNADSTMSYWGSMYLFQVVIDTNGVSHTDSVVVDGFFYAPTSDANSGYHAIEMRNAHNYTTNEGIAGRVSASTAADFSTFSTFIPVPGNFRPANLSFYYKYFSVNGDSGAAHLEMFDAFTNIVGTADFIITGTVSSYTLATVPVNYVSQDTILYYTLDFTTFRTSTPGMAQPGYGTRLLVDDVTMDSPTSINTISDDGFEIYPNPVEDRIHVKTKTTTGNFTFDILDSNGRIVLEKISAESADVSKLERGIYSLRVNIDGKNLTRKFIRQ